MTIPFSDIVMTGLFSNGGVGWDGVLMAVDRPSAVICGVEGVGASIFMAGALRVAGGGAGGAGGAEGGLTMRTSSSSGRIHSSPDCGAGDSMGAARFIL